MFRNTVLLTQTDYYPLGDTPAMCLTQDLPPEQDADILCLGCGDARNILFTCFADATRKMDITCCDIEPGIHARNILLYSLLIDDKENVNIARIWNIYYHWKLDKESVGLLEAQAHKLLHFSESMDMWHGSVYGSCIRFCDSRSLSLVRSYWNGFWLQGLPPVEKKQRMNQLQAAIDRAKTFRKKVKKREYFQEERGHFEPDFCAAIPVGLKASKDLSNIRHLWWDCGTSWPAPNTTELNPMFLFSPNETLMLHFGISPLVGFPLSTAYLPFTKGSTFSLKRNDKSPTKRLFDCAISHFTQWACAFRKAVEKKSVIRIFCGDALTFCYTLRNCQLTGATSANFFCDHYTSSPLVLNYSDYGRDRNNVRKAPLSFNVVDTSSLANFLGPLNVFAAAASLLKYDLSSSLYMEMMFQRYGNISNWLSGFFGVDVGTISLLLGVILPELYTCATNSVSDEILMNQFIPPESGTQICSRLRWKRSGGFEGSPYIRLEADMLAKLLLKVYEEMFRPKDSASPQFNRLLRPLKQTKLCYNRASFAVLLNLVKATVITNWDQCIRDLYDNCIKFDSLASDKLNFAEELLLQMYLLGVDSGKFPKLLSHSSQFKGILVPFLPVSAGENIPDQICVTICVPREKLRVLTGKKPKTGGFLILVCAIEGGDPGETPWLNFFSSVQIVFGTWCAPAREESYPFINEDSSQLSGNSDMFASFMVPTSILLAAHHSVPFVKCGLLPTTSNINIFSKNLDEDLCFVRSEMTSNDIFITRFMPGLSGLPTLTLVSTEKAKTEKVFNTFSVCLTDDGSKIDTVRWCMIPDCPAAKAKLAAKSSEVKLRFDSPMIAGIQIADLPRLKLEFPIPVSSSKRTFKIRRKFSYIEIESPPFDPLVEKMASFMFPTFITRTPAGNIPTPWTSTCVDLDAMPPVDLKDEHTLDLLVRHTISMFSNREQRICQSKRVDTGTSLKRGLDRLFTMFMGVQYEKVDFFCLQTEYDTALQMLIVPACLRLDLVNRTVVLDAAIIPSSGAMSRNDRKAFRSFHQITSQRSIVDINKSDAELRAWKTMMPALVERCRTWKHSPACEYLSAGEVPLSKALTKNPDDDIWPICKCGVGKFPKNYLKSLTKELSELSYLIDNYATRVAIAPIFVPSVVEGFSLTEIADADFVKILDDQYWKRDFHCANCDVAGGDLLECSACGLAWYCSKECQRSNWKVHKEWCKHYEKGNLKNEEIFAHSSSDESPDY